MDPITLFLILFLGFILVLFLRHQFQGSSCNLNKDLTGKIILITGGNTGIGKSTAIGLANQNATIILACRDIKKTEQAILEIKEKTKNEKISYIRLDLSSFKSIKECAESFKKQYDHLDILINNAGIIGVRERKTTEEGFESQFGVNFLGHFYFTNLLLGHLKKSKESRVITLSSTMHQFVSVPWEDLLSEKKYFQWKAYSLSKLALVLFTRELQRRFDEEGLRAKAVSVHPGLVRTDISRNIISNGFFKFLEFLVEPMFWIFFKTPAQGAQSTLQCVLEDFEGVKGGEYYQDCKPVKTSKNGRNMEDAKRLWVEAEKLVKSKGGAL